MLHWLGLTERRAAKELRLGRNTAREYRRTLAAAGVLDGSAALATPTRRGRCPQWPDPFRRSGEGVR
jgi:hypothetical protein